MRDEIFKEDLPKEDLQKEGPQKQSGQWAFPSEARQQAPGGVSGDSMERTGASGGKPGAVSGERQSPLGGPASGLSASAVDSARLEDRGEGQPSPDPSLTGQEKPTEQGRFQEDKDHKENKEGEEDKANKEKQELKRERRAKRETRRKEREERRERKERTAKEPTGPKHREPRVKARLIGGALLGLGAGAIYGLGPLLLGLAVDQLVQGVSGQIFGAGIGMDMPQLRSRLLLLGGIGLVSLLCRYFHGLLLTGISGDLGYDLGNRLEQKLNRLPMQYFHGAGYQGLLNRFTGDVDRIEGGLVRGFSPLVLAAAQLLAMLGAMFYSSWRMALVVLCSLPLTLGLMVLTALLSRSALRGRRVSLDLLTEGLEGMTESRLVITGYGKEQTLLADFEEENRRLDEADRRARFFAGNLRPGLQFLSGLWMVLLCLLGASLVSGGTLGIGGILEFLLFGMLFPSILTAVMPGLREIREMAGAWERVSEFLGEKEEPEERPRMLVDELEIRGAIRFDHVSFGYEGSAQPVLQDVTAEIAAGETVALVGPPGGGKSTLLRLLMGDYPLRQGKIWIDGEDKSDFAREDIRQIFASSSEEPWICGESIRENIRFGDVTAGDAQVEEAAALVLADELIRQLPGGYDRRMGPEGEGLSLGQRQQIALARGILSDPKVLILDNATTGLDTRTEELVLGRVTQGRTALIIPHRIQTARDADKILFMDQGRVLEQGSHAQLLQNNGAYARFYHDAL